MQRLFLLRKTFKFAMIPIVVSVAEFYGASGQAHVYWQMHQFEVLIIRDSNSDRCIHFKFEASSSKPAFKYSEGFYFYFTMSWSDHKLVKKMFGKAV